MSVLPWPIAECLHKSRKSLNKIGEGDWTPQDTAHLALVQAVEEFFALAKDWRYSDEFIGKVARSELRSSSPLQGDAKAPRL